MLIRRRPDRPAIAVDFLTFHLATGIEEPRNILEAIVWQKEIEVEQLRERVPLASLKKKVALAPAPRDFLAALTATSFGLIAEVKKASPSKGVLREDFDPVTLAQDYVRGGASCISVLTDRKFFQGSFENLEKIREAVTVPLLCKEFILHAYQLFLARSYGADAVLLIVTLHNDQDLQYLHRIGRTLGMTVLVEVHSEEELDRALLIPGVQLIGINNRNLMDFTVDLQTTVRLLAKRQAAHPEISFVAESGIHSFADVQYLQQAGCQGFLVGESLVRATDTVEAVQKLLGVI
jgi:indole-3-glycerol phosphate synthase